MTLGRQAYVASCHKMQRLLYDHNMCDVTQVTHWAGLQEDLDIIFSRFGNVTDCSIIRDFKTGDSLCYGRQGRSSPGSVRHVLMQVIKPQVMTHEQQQACCSGRCCPLCVSGFIGFDNDASCEEAYFKMNNVLIDDRRIKVSGCWCNRYRMLSNIPQNSSLATSWPAVITHSAEGTTSVLLMGPTMCRSTFPNRLLTCGSSSRSG
jgi:hypothetical protein